MGSFLKTNNYCITSFMLKIKLQEHFTFKRNCTNLLFPLFLRLASLILDGRSNIVNSTDKIPE